MEAKEVLEQARETMTVKRVFGEPYEKDGVTFVPVANIMGGAGAGGGTGMGPRHGAPGDGPDAEGAPDSGYGMGYGVRATPAGVYVIQGGEVEWKPAVDMNSLFLQRALVAIVGLLVLRSIVKVLVRR
jgi:uncharacterized spore protein YtfJ